MAFARDVHIDSALSNFASNYVNGKFVADLACPVVQSAKRSDYYFTFARKDAATVPNTLMGPDSEANESGYAQASSQYSCVDYALKGYVSNDMIDNADAPLDPLMDETDHLTRLIMLDREIRVATLMQTTTNYASANTSAASNKWSDETNGMPLSDLQTMIAALAPDNGENTVLRLVLALETWQALSKHPDMRGGGALRSVATMDDVRTLVGIDEILVSDAEKNTANYGQTASYSRIWNKTYAVLVRVPKGAVRTRQRVFAATMRYTPSGYTPVVTRRWDEPKRGIRGSQCVQVGCTDDEIVVQNDNGYCLTTVL